MVLTGYKKMPEKVLYWVPLEVSHKGQRHKISQMIQESQQDSESGMRVECFV